MEPYRNMQNIRLAIVEDDPATIERIQSVLSTAKDISIVAVARNWSAGVALIDNGGFDVLLCDLGLPDGSGIDLIRRTSRLYPAADVIVITIFADQAKVIESIKAGARGYLLKDDKFDECAEGIREIRNGGSPISPVIARQLLRQFQHPQSTQQASGEKLSNREMEVLNLLSRGFSFVEISSLLNITKNTVATYVKQIYQKLEVNSRAEAVYEASCLGLIDISRTA
jgi:DNA-binding NarL/FixJ family response regulator